MANKINIPIVRIYNENLPRLKYEDVQMGENLHWGQRKLLLSEIEFLVNNYHKYDTGKKYLLYIGASPGYHLEYLSKMFPEIYFILYDRVDSSVKHMNRIKFNKEYFTDESAQKYKNMNIMIVSDIRNLEIGQYKKKKHEESESKMDKIVFDDQEKQRIWCNIINPKAALLKFKLSWNYKQTEYFDGDIYFQIWNRNNSLEARMVPKLHSSKVYNNKIYEEVFFYYNKITRRTDFKNNSAVKDIFKNIQCVGTYYDGIVESMILYDYIKKFEYYENGSEIEIKNRICEISISITLLLQKWSKKNIPDHILKTV